MSRQAGSPAAGSLRVHQQEQDDLLERAVGTRGSVGVATPAKQEQPG